MLIDAEDMLGHILQPDVQMAPLEIQRGCKVALLLLKRSLFPK
jgi:hypothetical protein